MKIVRVTYSTKAAYADQNQTNIKNVMAELQKLDPPGVNYHVCLGADGRTFTHTAFFQADRDEKILLELPAFRHFQELDFLRIKVKITDTTASDLPRQ